MIARSTLMKRPHTLISAVLLIVFLACTTTAFAQGRMDTLPDPITGKDLTVYANRLSLNEQQLAQAENSFQQYNESFTRLTETSITRFREDMRKLNRGPMAIPSAKEMRDLIKSRNAIIRQIAGYDNLFFDQLLAIANADQTDTISRLRNLRQRKRMLMDEIGMMTRGSTIDLSEVVYARGLPETDLKAARDALASYESELTRRSVELNEAVVGVFEAMVERMETMPELTAEDVADAEAMAELQESFMQTMREAYVTVAKEAAKIGRLNRRSLEHLATAMSEENYRLVRKDFLARAYRRIMSDNTHDQLMLVLDRASRSRAVNEDLKSTLASTRKSYEQAYETHCRKLMDLSDEIREKGSPFDWRNEEQPELREKIDSTLEDRTELTQSTSEQVRNLLGEDLSDRLAAGDVDSAGDNVTQALAGVIGEDATSQLIGTTTTAPDESAEAQEAAVTADSSAYRADPYFPAAISTRDIIAMGQVLGIDESQQAVIDTLHAGYLEQFNEKARQLAKPIQELQQKQWRQVEGDMQHTPLTDAEIEDMYDLRERGMRELVALDQRFLADAEAMVALTDKQMTRYRWLRFSRTAQVYGNDSSRGVRFGFGAESNESAVDIVSLIRSIELTDNEEAIVEQTITDMAGPIETSLKALYKHTLDMQKHNEQWTYRWQHMEELDDQERMQQSMDFQQQQQQLSKPINEATKQLVGQYREILNRWSDGFSSENGDTIRQAYYRQAYPSVYRDEGSMHSTLEKVLGLPDLTDEQRDKVLALQYDYKPAYDQSSEKLIDIYMDSPVIGPGWSSETWEERRQIGLKVSDVERERNNQNQKVRRHLKAILTDTQAKRVGIDQEPKPQRRWGF